MSEPRAGHLAEEDLVLHFYGEAARAAELDAHLDVCASCHRRWDDLREALGAVTEESVAGGPAPAFGPDQVERAWRTLAPRLLADRQRRHLRRLMVPLALAASLIVAFTVGRRWPVAPAEPPGGPQRVLLVAVGDHLERSEMLLVELVNAPGDEPVDIGAEQVQAQELLGASRLYRAAATRAGEPGLASVLEEVERLLVEVAHRPSPIAPDELSALRQRIESRGLLFKVRVLEWQVREKQKEPAPRAASVS
jgi:hypothetical protein